MPNFNSIGSGVSEPQVAENRYLPLTGGIALTTVYALTCYTVIRRGSQNSEIGSRDPMVTPIDLIFHFFSLVPLGFHLHAKFRVSSFYRSRDTEGVPTFLNWVTWPPGDPYWPNFSIFLVVPTVVNLSVKTDRNMFVGDRYMTILSLSWFGCKMPKCNFGEVFRGLNVVRQYLTTFRGSNPQKTPPQNWPE